MFFSVFCLLCLCARQFICALWSPAGKWMTSWLSFEVSNCEFVTVLSFEVSNCEFVTVLLVSWVRCGT